MLVTLMHQDNEVLEFDFDLAEQSVQHIRPLGTPELALPGTLDGTQEANERLGHFLRSRTLSSSRPDFDRILEATRATSAIELAMRAGGFSLSDQYWYSTRPGAFTWQESNCFCNAWDPTFGEAILSCDYATLANADITVPDVTCRGRQRKAWVLLDGEPHLLKASADGSDADLFGEVLSSRLFELLLDPDDFVPYKLVLRDGTAYSSSPLFVKEGIDLLSTSTMESTEAQKASEGPWRSADWESLRRLLNDFGVDDGECSLTKLAVASTLCLNGDENASNLGVMRNHAANTLRLAPLYDFGGAFGTFNYEVARAARANQQLAIILVTWGFRGLDPSWDYSWCDLTLLEGFGETVEDMLGQCEALAGDYPAFARMLFESQLAYVASVVAP